MTDREAQRWVGQIYTLTAFVALIGFVSYFLFDGLGPAGGFALGAVGSFGNLWLFERLAFKLTPGPLENKPWRAGTYAVRYLLLIAFGYVIVKALRVNGLPVVLGLLSTTVAALLASLAELIRYFLGNRRAH